MQQVKAEAAGRKPPDADFCDSSSINGSCVIIYWGVVATIVTKCKLHLYSCSC